MFYEHRSRLCGCALRMLRNHEDAEEVVQDAMMRAYVAWIGMTPERRKGTTLGPWLFTITVNLARTRLRRKRETLSRNLENLVHWSREADQVPSNPESIVERSAAVALVQNAIRQLPSHLGEPTWLHYVEDLSYPEIARMLNQPRGTVKSRVFRATAILRRRLCTRA